MNYCEALKIGKKAEGTIKCTFATIYDEDGKGLFSLQRVKAQYGVEYKNGYSMESKESDMTITQLSPDIYFTDAGFGGANQTHDSDITGGITFDIPLVYAMQISNDRLVPAKLTEKAIEIIQNACKNVMVTKFTVWMVVDKFNPNTPSAPQPGYRKQVTFTYVMTNSDRLMWQNKRTEYIHYEIMSEKAINPRYIKLSEILEERGTVYVKPLAFDWNALDINEATVIDKDGNAVKITDALDLAYKKMQSAKALLAVAGTSIII